MNNPQLQTIVLETEKQTPRHEIYDRGTEGFFVYAKGMDASQIEKAKILPYVKPGIIAEMGSGSGTVLELLSQHFPDSQIIGVDISDSLLELSSRKKYANNNVSLIKADVKKKNFKDESLDTITLCSTLHEVYSYSGYDKSAITETLRNAYDMLKPGGRLIIRDGPKPEEEIFYMSFKNLITSQKFKRFANEFGPYKIPYVVENGLIKLTSSDAMEFLSKYIYEKNWAIEVKEQFGIYTKKEYAKEIEKIGFKVIHQESYLIDWLRQTHYEKDVELFRANHKTGKLERADYPDSTMIIVAEKPLYRGMIS